MATQLTLRCNNCRCIISQDEADRASRIFEIVGLGPDGTFCVDCATSIADSDGSNDDEYC